MSSVLKLDWKKVTYCSLWSKDGYDPLKGGRWWSVEGIHVKSTTINVICTLDELD